MSITMGTCTECGHRQPGEANGDVVELLADDGCSRCDNSDFEASEA